MTDRKIRLLNTYLPLIIGFITAETIVFLGRNDDMANYIGLIVALITVAGSLLANFFQFKKDSNRISEVKVDTSEMKPDVKSIREYSKETNDCITKDMRHDVNEILKNTTGEMKANLDFLTEDLKFRRRLEESYRGSNTREHLVASIDELYADNAIIKQQNLKLRNESREKNDLIKSKDIQIESLNKKNNELQIKIRDLEQQQEKRVDRELER